jgi:hypothetical protein
MSKEEYSVKEMERESFQFFGTKGKVKWVDFEKSIARHFRMKFGSIGEKLWMNELPIIDGDNVIDAQEFADHAQEVLEAIGYSTSKVRLVQAKELRVLGSRLAFEMAPSRV